MGRLILCATPLGNLEDITLRALRVLQEVDLIAAEDTRHTRQLLSHYGIKTPLTSYHEHNERTKAEELVAELAAGKSVAVVSDAGMPCVSDPGYRVVQAALEAGFPVTALPGPSAAVTALALSGFRPYPYYFYGFLPRNSGERSKLLAALRDNPSTGLFYEAPHRLLKTLEELCAVWGERRRIAVARELTKQFEEVVRGSTAEVLAHFQSEAPRGEITLVTEGCREGEEKKAEPELEDQVLQKAVESLVEAGASLPAACKGVALALGLGKSMVYRACHRK